MNTYKKFAPKVFVAACEERQEKGSTIIVTTRYGKENECIVFNLVGRTNDGKFCYSIVRADGFNSQEWAKRKSERFQGYADSANKRSSEAYKKADLSEEATGIVFGQPILVGHYSEKRHRKTIERADNAMRKSVKERDKANDYKSRAEYWESRAKEINLSMPESLEFYEYKYHEAEEYHEGLKSGKYLKRHSFDVPYANKAKKEALKKFELAKKLWGDN